MRQHNFARVTWRHGLARDVRRTLGIVAVSMSRRARAARRRKGRMDRADNDLTATQWASIKAAWGGCAYCGTSEGSMQRDCVLPLSRGGRYTIANVVPACRSCNASKGNEEVTHWLRRKHLDERAFLLRLREVNEELVATTNQAVAGA